LDDPRVSQLLRGNESQFDVNRWRDFSLENVAKISDVTFWEINQNWLESCSEILYQNLRIERRVRNLVTSHSRNFSKSHVTKCQLRNCCPGKRLSHDPDHLAPKRKVAQSRFILLNELSAHQLAAQINWDDVIPSESNAAFENSLNTEISSFQEIYHRLAQFRTIATIFRINNITY
jgi:hypothetical protein